MSGARAEILRRIATALGPDRPAVAVPRGYHRAGATVLEDRVGLLEERLRDYGAGVFHCRPDEVATSLATRLSERGAMDVVTPAGFPQSWLPPGTEAEAAPRSVAELDRADAVVTTCRVAIASTGTIVLDAGPGQGERKETLLPDYHLVVVVADQVVATVPDAVALLDPAAPLTWISGPSATSDIELERVQGVHGPRTLDVLVVRDAPG
jgi:L-lactate dehydrogenase complex protein LldG